MNNIIIFDLMVFIVIFFLWSSYSVERVQRTWDNEEVWCSNWYWGSWFAWHCFKTKRGLNYGVQIISIQFRHWFFRSYNFILIVYYIK